MRTFAQKPKVPQQATPAKSTIFGRAHVGQSHEVNSILHLQRTIGNHAVQRLLQANPEELAAGSATTASTHFEHDFSRIRVHPPAAGSIPTQLAINKPGDEYQPEADRVAEQVMRASEPQLQCLQVDSIDSGSTVVPPIVHEVLRSAGQPLSAATRGVMEPRFGHDFSEVRVHTDAKAAESARDLNASAYTVGSNIVFGAGQFLPETQTGRHLLSYELTHVAQQRRSPVPVARGVSVPSDSHERQAGAVADALMRGGNIAPLLDSGPGPISHSLQRQPAPSPARPLKYDRTVFHIPSVPQGQSAASLRQALNNKVNQGIIVSFTTRGGTGNTEIFMLAVLFSLAERGRWGTETDVVTPIDWPAKAGDSAPRGQITVRIDHNGAASAELIARGVPVVTQQTTAAALKTDFKLAAVTDDGTARWSPNELNDVGAALDLLPGGDKAALEGVELIRVNNIPGKPSEAGQFEFPQPVAASASAVGINAKLRLTSRAFDRDTLQFFGGTRKTVPASFQTILHEVGHAVESEVYRSKWRAHAQALAETKAAGNVQESDARKKERKEVEDKIKTAKTQAEKDRLEKKLLQYDLDLALISETATDKKAAETKLKEKEKEVTDMDVAGQTERLRKFVDLVTRNRIAPFTDYSRQGNKEFYAEAYSLWLVDPEFLQTNYRVVYNFFENGDYRQ